MTHYLNYSHENPLMLETTMFYANKQKLFVHYHWNYHYHNTKCHMGLSKIPKLIFIDTPLVKRFEKSLHYGPFLQAKN